MSRRPKNLVRPDVDALLSTLKDFQLRSVHYIFDQFIQKKATKRFLLADEVGLGKTMVARGVVARVVDHLWERKDRIDIAYICSNAEIARQNINRLNIMKEVDFQQATRLSLLPMQVRNIRNNRMNFIALTPNTSFNLRSHQGKAEERWMLYWFLRSAWPDITTGMAPMNVLEGWMGRDRFRDWIRRFDPEKHIDESLQQDFVRKLHRTDGELKKRKQPTLRQEFEELCEFFRRRNQDQIPLEMRQHRDRFVGELRSMVAKISIESLEPDLVILDEFQRFKSLLKTDNDAGLLADHLFKSENVRVLLLSATPYKMYTLNREEEDDHHKDFVATLDFLLEDPEQTRRLETLLNEYRAGLYRVERGENERLLHVKDELEELLRRVMSRTERLSVSQNRSGMLREVGNGSSTLAKNDVHAFVHLQEIARLLDRGSVMEYWKSAPYLLNFMENYELKRTFRNRIDSPGHNPALQKRLKKARELLLPWNRMGAYEELDPANPRVRQLTSELLDNDSWKMLWLAPSLPYYKIRGMFGNEQAQRMTKRLIFSSWFVVPRSLSVLISYEAERRMMLTDPNEDTDYAAYAKRRPLLQFSRSYGRLTGMPVLGLLYPSFTLAQAGDPLDLQQSWSNDSPEEPDRTVSDVTGGTSQDAEAGHPDRDTDRPTMNSDPPDAAARQPDPEHALPDTGTILREVQQRLEAPLEELTHRYADPDSEREDEAWYWAAPVLLDKMTDPEAAESWWRYDDLARHWSDRTTEQNDERSDQTGDEGWNEHVREARELFDGRHPLGRPPRNLAEVMAKMAVAGPANCALRALSRVAQITVGDAGRNSSETETRAENPVDPGWEILRHPDIRVQAGHIAWAFRTLFNLPTSINLIRGHNRKEPYWERVLEYCADGCLQSVLDEYAHVLRESLGLIDTTQEKTASEIASAMASAIGLHAATPQVDIIESGRNGITIEPQRLRARYAMRFGDEKHDDSGTRFRGDEVRQAFNSPFRPFVLATTSLGQEGLDFHPYCHAVVHWNLPSNPVDLEQREGRIHRYKGHAVRRNIAERYGNKLSQNGWNASHDDPWQYLFRLATEEPGRASDLTPFWIYADGRYSIERHVPTLPMSREISRLSALRQSLAIYRMVFGQPRQEDLLEHLQQRLSKKEMEGLMEKIRIDLAP